MLDGKQQTNFGKVGRPFVGWETTNELGKGGQAVHFWEKGRLGKVDTPFVAGIRGA